MDGPSGTYGEKYGSDFQSHVLAVCLRSDGFVHRFRTALQPNYFSSEINSSIASALFSLVDKHQITPSRATLLEEVRENASEESMPVIEGALNALYARNIKDVDAVREKVVDFARTQALVNAILSGAADIQAGKQDGIVDRIREAMAVGEDISALGLFYMEATAGQRSVWYDAANAENIIPTGMVDLDRAMGGGLGRGELGIFLGVAKKGKSACLVNAGYGALLAGRNVIHYTFEMSQSRVSRRYDARLAGEFAGLWRTDREKYIRIVEDRAKKFMRGSLVIHHRPTRSMSANGMRSHIRLLISHGFRPDLAVVDYGDIMRPERRMKEERHQQAGIFEDLRSIAGEFNIAVWTASQGNRAAMKKDIIRMDDIAESIEKIQIADAVIGLCQTEQEKAMSVFRFSICGLRNEEDGGIVECTFDRGQQKIVTTGWTDSANIKRASTPTEDRLLSKVEGIKKIKKIAKVG